jgi:hypothetical protein
MIAVREYRTLELTYVPSNHDQIHLERGHNCARDAPRHIRVQFYYFYQQIKSQTSLPVRFVACFPAALALIEDDLMLTTSYPFSPRSGRSSAASGFLSS